MEQGAKAAIDEVRGGLLQLTGGDKASVELWLASPHPALDGATPKELIDSGESELVAKLIRHMLSGAPA